MKSLIAGLLLLVACGTVGGEELPTVPPQPPADLSWNRYETANFEILAISKDAGDDLSRSVEYMRRWIYDRWGLKEVDFSVKCKVFLVPTRDLYVKLFNTDRNGCRVDRESTGKIKALTIWLWTEDKWQTTVLPHSLTSICFAEFEQKYKTQLPIWFQRGAAVLNRNTSEISKELGGLSKIYSENLPCFWTEDLVTMTAERLGRYQPQNQAWFDGEAACLCLYVMKTHGKTKFLAFLESSMQDAKSAPTVVGMGNYKDFDKAFNRYMFNLSKDLLAKQTPKSYLTWPSK